MFRELRARLVICFTSEGPQLAVLLTDEARCNLVARVANTSQALDTPTEDMHG
jgi:hypothetical protein